MNACVFLLVERHLPMSEFILKPPPYLSPSSISTFQQCPLKYKFSRIDGLQDPPTEATLRGNFVHSILEDLYSLPKDERTLDRAKLVAKEWWEMEYAEKIAPYVKGDEAVRLFRWSSWWCVENLFAMEDPTALHFDGIETELNDTIDGVAIKGFIDRWRNTDDGIIVGDYKTGKTPSPRYRDDKYFQLLLYAYVLEKQLNQTVKEIELLFIKDAVLLSKTVTDEDRENVRSTVVHIRKEIDLRCVSGEFEPIKHRLCDWCSYKKICPEWNK